MGIAELGVWQAPSSHSSSHRHHHHHHHHSSSEDDDDGYAAKYKYTRKTYVDDEPTNKYKYEMTYHGRPSSSSHSYSDKPMFWPGDLFKSKDKWEQVDYMKEKREHKNDFWNDDDEIKETTRYRKVKRSKTNEWKPLGGFRRF